MPNTQECLIDFLASLPWKAEPTEWEKLQAKRHAINEIALKLGVSPRTVYRWSIKKQRPIGIPLLKLRYLMEDYGYYASEFAGLTQQIRSLGAIIARSGVDYNVVARKLGFSQSANLFRVLHGQCGLSARRQRIVEDLISEFIAQAQA
jgi:hypothetical protein